LSSAARTDGAVTQTLDTTEGLYRETRQVSVDAPPEAAFDMITRLGGDTGWLFADGLWRLRGWWDQVTGGVGFRKGRRHPTDLRVGDAVDFWRVEQIDPPRLLRLRAEMDLPGRAWLQLEVRPAEGEDGCTVVQSVYFEPKGLWGTVYWTLVAWPHRWVFAGMLRALKTRIESRSDAMPTMAKS
jgi:hypothetical protein